VFFKIRRLFADLVIYGLGDVATTLVGFLLLPVFTRILSPAEYGVWGLLLTVELVAKIVFRWGVDAAFMRFYYDCADHEARRRLASTIFLFLLVLNGAILAIALAGAPLLARHLFGVAGHTLTLRIVLVYTFVGSFFFFPFHLLRMRGEAWRFSALTFSRSAATILLRVLLIVWARWGVPGVVSADLVVTLAFAIVLARRFAPYIGPIFDASLLRGVLRFGLPRVPHGVAQQVIGPGTDAYLLGLFLREPPAAALARIGTYWTGASLGLALKLFLSAFEYAWAPFYFETMKEKDAKRTFAGITTYGISVLVLLAAGLSAIATDLVRLMMAPAFHEAARVVPWLTIAVVFQGVYLLTSIGLNITKHTEYYPVCTALAAVTNVTANAVLIPRFGFIAAAWSSVIAYGVLAVTAYACSQRFYPTRYEWRRIAMAVGAAVVSYGVAVWAVPPVTPIAGILLRGLTVVMVFPAMLAAVGFLRPAEIARLRQIVARLAGARRARHLKDEQPRAPEPGLPDGAPGAEDPTDAPVEWRI